MHIAARLAIASILATTVSHAHTSGLAEITVVAPRPPKPEEIAGDNVATFIRTHGKPGKRIGQLGRWEKAPCPAAVGLSPAFNEFITTRIQAIENAVHISQQSAQPCKQDVLIVFTTEPQAFLDDVAKNRPR